MAPPTTCIMPSSAQRCSVGNTLPGLSRPGGIEGAFDAHLLREIDLVEHLAHQIALFDADAMLAGQHAADRDAKPQNVGAERFGALDVAVVRRVVENERMQIAVAGVKHIGDAQSVLLAPAPPCRSSTSGSRAARDRAVHAKIVGADAAHRRKGVLAPGPELQPLGLAGRSLRSSSRPPRARFARRRRRDDRPRPRFRRVRR